MVGILASLGAGSGVAEGVTAKAGVLALPGAGVSIPTWVGLKCFARGTVWPDECAYWPRHWASRTESDSAMTRIGAVDGMLESPGVS